MKFKKKYIKKNVFFVLNILWITWILSVFILWYVFVKSFNYPKISIAKKVENKIEKTIKILKKIWKIDTKEYIEEEKDSQIDDKINILVVWRWWKWHDAPNLTDTIMLVSISTKKEIISILSIPRDLYVEYNDWKIWRINRIYEIDAIKHNSEEKWMISVMNKVEQITWEKINFFVNVDFYWFTKIIDVLWWIPLRVDEDFVDNAYPDWKWWYKTITFKKWTWLFDGENALKYARSRHSTSDFNRSLRQQQIISATKEKLSVSYFVKSPLKLKELYDTFYKYVYTDLTLKDILTLALEIKLANYTTHSFNLNDSCFYWSTSCEKWWFLYVPERWYFGWASVLLAEWTDKNNLNNYKIIHKYTNLIFNNQNLFSENYKINVFNSLNKNFLASIFADNIKKYGFNIPKKNSVWNTKKTYEKSIIYYNNIESDSQTLKILKEFFKEIEFKKVSQSQYSKDSDTKIEIIIWKDYTEKIWKDFFYEQAWFSN